MDMNVTLLLDDDLVKKVRKIAAERNTTVTGLIREYLERLATENVVPGRRQQEREALERSFAQFRIKLGRRNWKREDLHERA